MQYREWLEYSAMSEGTVRSKTRDSATSAGMAMSKTRDIRGKYGDSKVKTWLDAARVCKRDTEMSNCIFSGRKGTVQ